MSNIKKGSKLTVSTGNGISRSSSNNLGILEVSGPGLANVVSQDSTFSIDSSNIPQLTLGAIDNSGIFQMGLDNQGNAILEATENGSNNNILIQQLGGYVGIGTNNPASTFHVNSTDGLIIPVGTSTNRPGESGQITAQNGMIRYNTSTSQFEGYGPGGAWGSLGGVKDVDGDTYILAETTAGTDNDDLQFYTGGQERLIIDSSGYVGIGNSNPQTELDISGQITANTKEYAFDISFNNNASYNNWILFNSSYGNAGDVPVNTDWTIEYKHKITGGPSAAGDAHFGVVLEEDGISSTDWSSNTYFMYWQTDPSTNLTFRYNPADGTSVNEIIKEEDSKYRWSLFSDHVNVKLEFLTKNNTIRLYFNGENVQTISNISNPSKIFGRWGFGDFNDNTHNIINPRITYGGKTYHLTTQHSTSSTAPTLTTTTKNVELINSNNNQINIPKLHSTELYADKMFVGRNNFTDYTFNAERKLVASDGASVDYFGKSVAIDGDYAIVGAELDNDNGNDSGSAYIYNVKTGAEVHKLTASDGATGDQFGYSVAISGNYAIVGAWNNSDAGSQSGSAYIFNVHTGTQLHKLTASDAASEDRFGWSVAISDNYAIVGAYFDDDNGSQSGSAYIFNVQTGAELHKLTASDGVTSDQFGVSVAISGNYAIVGAYYYDAPGTGSTDNRGAAYIFNVQTGEQLYKLTASDGAASDQFGGSVAISGNYAIIAAEIDDSRKGSAYIFNVQTGEQLWKLTASDAETNDNFGTSVAISGNYAVVGAPYDDDVPSTSGSAYIFDVQTGMQVKKITASDANANDRFGYSVAISGNYAIMGAYYDNNDNGTAAGSAYIYGPNDPLPPLLSIDNDSGNVGIGTTEPKSLLDVNGTLQATTLTSTNIKVGTKVDYTFSDEKKILASDGAANDTYATGVAIDGNYAIVAAYSNDDNGSNSGSAYIYNVQTGTQIHKLTASDAASGDTFGYSVAISGNYAIVGAFGDDNGSGSAYIFNVQTGTQLHKLTASDAAALDYFGVRVAISGNYAIVGSYYDDDVGVDSGSVYIFNVQTGTQLRKLTASDGDGDDRFGVSVAISGNYAIVGAYYDEYRATQAGSAYIFDVETGTQLHKLTASDAAAYDYFGYSVAISGNYAIVGSYGKDQIGTNNNAGSAYIFNVQTGTQVHKITASDSEGSDYFGYSVAISGNYAIVGAQLDDDNGGNSGGAYLFNVITGEQLRKFIPGTYINTYYFGYSVAISGNYAIVGGYRDPIYGSDSGSAFIYGPSEPDTTLLNINDNGNVGIGTTNPQSLLEINGTMKANNINIGYNRDYYTFNKSHVISPSNPHPSDTAFHYGNSVDIYGKYAIVGAYYSDNAGSNAGNAYIYDVTDGKELHILNTGETVAADVFGNSVAIHGSRAVVAAMYAEDVASINESGIVYVFNVSNGMLLYKFSAPTPSVNGYFGSSVDIYRDRMVVAENGTDTVYLYSVNDISATLITTLAPNPNDVISSDGYGDQVAISNSFVVVASPFDDDNTSGSGSIYVFHSGSGAYYRKISQSASTTNDNLGRFGIAISEQYVIAGIPFGDVGSNSGEAIIYNVTTGSEYKLIPSPTSSSNYIFGYDVDIDGDYAIISASTDNATSYIYIYNIHTLEIVHQDSYGGTSGLGKSVAISKHYAVVGSPNDDTGNTNRGSVHIYGPNMNPASIIKTTDTGVVGIGVNDPNYLDRINQEPTPNATNFPELSKPGTGHTSPIKLDVGGSICLSPEYQSHSNLDVGFTAPNIYFPANNTDDGTSCGLIWRNYHSWGKDIKGAILFEPMKGNIGYASGGFGFYTSNYDGGSASSVTASCKMTIQGDGKVGIGTTSPNFPFHVNVSGPSSAWLSLYQTQGADIYLNHKDGYGMFIQTFNPTHTDYVYYTNVYALRVSNKNNDTLLDVKNGGTVTISSGTVTGSDDRVKHNEKTITNALTTISKLTPKHYIKTIKLYDASHNFLLDPSGNPLDTSGNPLKNSEAYSKETGIIAQEIQCIPELQFAVQGEEYIEETITTYKKDNSGNDILDESGNKIIESVETQQKPNMLTVDYNSIHCTHIAATKELYQLVQSQREEIEGLKSELSAIKAHLGL